MLLLKARIHINHFIEKNLKESVGIFHPNLLLFIIAHLSNTSSLQQFLFTFETKNDITIYHIKMFAMIAVILMHSKMFAMIAVILMHAKVFAIIAVILMHSKVFAIIAVMH